MLHVRWQRVIDYGVYLVVRVVICAVQAISIETCQAGTRLLAWVFCCALRIRRGVVDDNLRHAYPNLSSTERQQMARAMWEHLFLMVVEIAHARRKIHPYNWYKYVRLVNAPELVRGLLDPRPTVLVTGH